MKNVLFLFCFFTAINLLAQKEAQVQFIQNLGLEGNQEIDIWMTTPSGSELFIDNFEFRTATAFKNVLSNTDISFSIADASSTSIFDTLPGFTFHYVFKPNEVYVIIAESTTEELGTINKEFELVRYATGKLFTEKPGYTDVLLHHGKKNMISLNLQNLKDDFKLKKIYKNDVLAYLKLPTNDYTIEARDTFNTDQNLVKSFKLPLETWEASTKKMVILASGYISNLQDFPNYEFGMYAAMPNGGALISLEEIESEDENFQLLNLVIEPNPTNRYIKIPELNDKITSLSLFNVSGERKASLANVRDNILDVSSLEIGYYELVITTASKRISYIKIEKY